MEKSNRHIAVGIEAVIDSAHVVGTSDIWVDAEDSAKTVSQIVKLVDERYLNPRVYTGQSDSRICVRLD